MSGKSPEELKAEIAKLEAELKGLNQECEERQEALKSARSLKGDGGEGEGEASKAGSGEEEENESENAGKEGKKKGRRRGGKKKKGGKGGDEANKGGEEGEELRYAKSEVALCPRNAQCRLDLSGAYEACGRFREAYAEARAATTYIKTYGRAWKARGRLELLLDAEGVAYDDDDGAFLATPLGAAEAPDDAPVAPAASDAADAAAKAAEEKQKGNGHFVAKRHNDAISHWTFAIDLLKTWDLPADAKLHSNRAAAYLALKKHVNAATDGKLAVDADANWWKGHWYFGQATLELVKASAAKRGPCTSNGERAQEAYRAFVKCADCDTVPANKRFEVEQMRDTTQQKIYEMTEQTGCSIS